RQKPIESAFELTDYGTNAVGEHHGAASFNDRWVLGGHDVGAEVKLTRGDADHRDHYRRSKTDHHNLEVGRAIGGVEGGVHALNKSSRSLEEHYISGEYTYTNVQCGQGRDLLVPATTWAHWCPTSVQSPDQMPVANRKSRANYRFHARRAKQYARGSPGNR